MSENTKLREALTTLGLAEYANELLGESTATLSNVPAVFERPISIGGSGSELARVTPDGTTTIHWPAVEQAAKEDHFLSAVAKMLIAARDVGRAPAPAQEAAAPQGWRFKRNADDSIGIFAPPPKPGESQRTSHVVYPGQNRDLHELLGKLADKQAATPAPAPAVPSVQQGWVEQMLTDARHVFDARGPETPQETRDVIEYVASWIAAYRDNLAATPAPAPAQEPVTTAEVSARYRFLMALLIDRGVLTDRRYSNGTWSLQGIALVDDSGLRGAGRTPEEAIDNAIEMARLNPNDQLTKWRETHEQIAQEVTLTDDERQQVFRNAETRMVREINLSWRTAVVDEVIAALRAKEKT